MAPSVWLPEGGGHEMVVQNGWGESAHAFQRFDTRAEEPALLVCSEADLRAIPPGAVEWRLRVGGGKKTAPALVAQPAENHHNNSPCQRRGGAHRS